MAHDIIAWTQSAEAVARSMTESELGWAKQQNSQDRRPEQDAGQQSTRSKSAILETWLDS